MFWNDEDDEDDEHQQNDDISEPVSVESEENNKSEPVERVESNEPVPDNNLSEEYEEEYDDLVMQFIIENPDLFEN